MAKRRRSGRASRSSVDPTAALMAEALREVDAGASGSSPPPMAGSDEPVRTRATAPPAAPGDEVLDLGAAGALSDEDFASLLGEALEAVGGGEESPEATAEGPAAEAGSGADTSAKLQALRAELDKSREAEKALSQRLEEAEAEASNLAEKLMRRDEQLGAYHQRLSQTATELEGVKRRSRRERDEARQYRSEALMRDLLPVLDDLDRARAAGTNAGTTLESLQQGVAMTLASLEAVLRRHQLEKVEAEQGSPFDPLQHEAMSKGHDPEVPDQHIVSVLQTGYSLHDRLLRPARVAVSAGPEPDQPPPDEREQQQVEAGESTEREASSLTGSTEGETASPSGSADGEAGP